MMTISTGILVLQAQQQVNIKMQKKDFFKFRVKNLKVSIAT